MLLSDVQEEIKSDIIEARSEIDDLFKESKTKLRESNKRKSINSMEITRVKDKKIHKSKTGKELGVILEAIDRSKGKKSKRKTHE
jgi:hypothetical protein